MFLVFTNVKHKTYDPMALWHYVCPLWSLRGEGQIKFWADKTVYYRSQTKRDHHVWRISEAIGCIVKQYYVAIHCFLCACGVYRTGGQRAVPSCLPVP